MGKVLNSFVLFQIASLDLFSRISLLRDMTKIISSFGFRKYFKIFYSSNGSLHKKFPPVEPHTTDDIRHKDGTKQGHQTLEFRS